MFVVLIRKVVEFIELLVVRRGIGDFGLYEIE